MLPPYPPSAGTTWIVHEARCRDLAADAEPIQFLAPLRRGWRALLTAIVGAQGGTRTVLEQAQART